MKSSAEKIQSPLAKARGLGSAHSGVEEWIKLRVTSIALIVLTAWFSCFLYFAVGASHQDFLMLLSHPVHAVGMILFVLFGFYHAMLGAREIIEDYVSCECMKIASLIGNYLFFFVLGVGCIFSVLKIALL